MGDNYLWMGDSYLWNRLKEHWGHDVKISCYGNGDSPDDVCLECEDCNEVIVDAGLYTLCPRNDFDKT